MALGLLGAARAYCAIECPMRASKRRGAPSRSSKKRAATLESEARASSNIAELQRVVGNRATSQLLTRSADAREHEADRVAAQVMRMDVPLSSGEPHTDRENAPVPHARSAAVAMGSGKPLDVMVRAFMEQRFGRDLSHVRVHDNEIAARTAARFGARALTLGSDIAFVTGAYRPETTDGKTLLAHELAHVAQQTAPEPAARGAAPVVSAAPAAVQLKRGEPPDPRPAVREEGNTHVVTIGGWEFAVIRSKSGEALKRSGAASGSYTPLEKPVASPHGSVSWSYTVTVPYENAQETLTVSPGEKRAHVEHNVLPAVSIQVVPRGRVQSRERLHDKRRKQYQQSLKFPIERLVEREASGKTQPGWTPPDPAEWASAWKRLRFSDLQNIIQMGRWESVEQLNQYIDEWRRYAKQHEEGRDARAFEERAGALKEAVQTEYDEATLRNAEAAALEAEAEIKRAEGEIAVQRSIGHLTTPVPPGLQHTPLAQFNKLAFAIGKPLIIAADVLISFVPIVGQIKLVAEILTGKTLSGQMMLALENPTKDWSELPPDLEPWERGLGAVLVALPAAARILSLGRKAGVAILHISRQTGATVQTVSKILRQLAALRQRSTLLQKALDRIRQARAARAAPKTLGGKTKLVVLPMLPVGGVGIPGIVRLAAGGRKLAAIKGQATKLMREVARGVREAHKAGGKKLSDFWQRIGRRSEDIAERVIDELPFKVKMEKHVKTGTSFIDRVIVARGRIAQVEVKYGVPQRAGEALNRLVKQIRNMVDHGKGQPVVWSVRRPTAAQLERVRKAVGDDYFNKVQFVDGVQGLFNWAKFFFGATK